MAKRKRVLLLGTGESGKSSIVKQVKQIFAGGLSSSELEHIRDVLRQNVITCILALVRAVSDLGIEVVDAADEDAMKRLTDAAGDEDDDSGVTLTPALVPDVLKVWETAAVQEAWARRSEFWVLDAAAYYFANAARIAGPAFVPNEEDAVMARVITTGIVETSYTDAGTDITLVDVGGQRSERRKWISCFDGVDAVIFVCALPEYNQVLYEDATQNRMKESLRLFGEVASNPAFRGTPVFLFLNKKDLFEKMMASTDLSVTFPEYRGGKDAAKGAAFVTGLFEQEFRRAVGPGPAFNSFVMASRVRMDVRETMKAVRGVLAPVKQSRSMSSVTGATAGPGGGSGCCVAPPGCCAAPAGCCGACVGSRAVSPSRDPSTQPRADAAAPAPAVAPVAAGSEVELAGGDPSAQR